MLRGSLLLPAEYVVPAGCGCGDGRRWLPERGNMPDESRIFYLLPDQSGNADARLKPMNQVGGKADTCGGLSTDTAFLFGNVAEGVVAVEPEAVFHGWRPARRECLPGGT